MNNVPVFLPSHHNLWVVAASLLLATLASYVALDLSRRVRHASGRPHLLWGALGSLAMGTGIWSMHFVGMLGFSLPISLGFSGRLTLISWVAGVTASGVALWVASEANYGLRRVAMASLAMAAGICGMHYIGMAALDMAPPIVWRMPIVLLSLLIGLAASAAALFIFKFLGGVHNTHRVAFQLLAAVVMGIAICGMHYTGMAAANFPADSVCLSSGALYGSGLTAIVAIAAGLLLFGTLFTSILESRLQLVAKRLSRSLEDANAELTQANQELQKRAFTDALTGLPNRVLFEDRLRHALARMDRANHLQVEERIAVLFVDLDGFKPINDSFGHAAGDQILCMAAERLARTTRESDTVARIGGDEFLLLLEGVRDRAECAEAANRVLRALSEPFNVLGKQLQIACSIGIVLHPEQGEPDKLVANADAAMYEAKRAGGGNYVMFEPHMGADAAKQLQLQSDLRRAVELKQFELYYQPKINGAGDSLSGVEALVRWNHPQHGLIGPTEFIGLAERFGLIVRLGDWILDEACRQIAQWRAQGTWMCVAVNLSVMQLREVDFVARVEQALARHDIPASLLLCEITESVAMEDIKATQRTFEGLARIGVFLSIDDFGTGYSSLSHLRKLPRAR
ncbi:diguanylate cyclase domain-containing protein [Variovorax sp. E3]|uniref:putative bifunctional diguanylate cyclase/phosphodiesterase n=1 Tax=Variovorax sp. E3 TaxID=1914993 RepID=UPI0027DD350D|nr:diguanylate cyclase [Variovorax sp. E3]